MSLFYSNDERLYITESKSKGLPDEPFGQHLAGFSAALSSVYVE
ncbi:MAG: hypothetical protein ACRC47_09375 [Shewanella sp.]